MPSVAEVPLTARSHILRFYEIGSKARTCERGGQKQENLRRMPRFMPLAGLQSAKVKKLYGG